MKGSARCFVPRGLSPLRWNCFVKAPTRETRGHFRRWAEVLSTNPRIRGNLRGIHKLLGKTVWNMKDLSLNASYEVTETSGYRIRETSVNRRKRRPKLLRPRESVRTLGLPIQKPTITKARFYWGYLEIIIYCLWGNSCWSPMIDLFPEKIINIKKDMVLSCNTV